MDEKLFLKYKKKGGPMDGLLEHPKTVESKEWTEGKTTQLTSAGGGSYTKALHPWKWWMLETDLGALTIQTFY